MSHAGLLRETATAVLTLALSRPARLGGARLVCVDGPAGSGKTTLAAALEQAAQQHGLTVATVHTDDVLDGWDGLDTLGPTLLREVVTPLLSGAEGSYRRYDWVRAVLAESVTVPLSDLVVLEGVGAGHAGYADVVAALVWVEAPRGVRRARGLARDGEDLMPHWDAFVLDEDRLHERERTHERADLQVDGLTGLVLETRQAGAGPSSSGRP